MQKENMISTRGGGNGTHFSLTPGDGQTSKGENDHAQSQLVHIQQMETGGQLAIGIAHDVNNILSALLLHLGLLRQQTPSSDELQSAISEMESDVNRGVALVKKMLSLGRVHAPEFALLKLGSVVSGLLNLLDRLLGDKIELLVSNSPDDIWIEADHGALEHVIINLAINARDAMSAGGVLSMQTELVDVDESFCNCNAKTRRGRFAHLIVKDTGCGMSADVLSRVFEPFYTTKPIGKGTGLGLTLARSFVEKHHGWLDLKSAPRQGTTVSLYLPAWPCPTGAGTGQVSHLREECTKGT